MRVRASGERMDRWAHGVSTHSADAQLELSGGAVHLVAEALDVIHRVHYEDRVKVHLALHRGEQCAAGWLLRSAVCAAGSGTTCTDTKAKGEQRERQESVSGEWARQYVPSYAFLSTFSVSSDRRTTFMFGPAYEGSRRRLSRSVLSWCARFVLPEDG